MCLLYICCFVRNERIMIIASISSATPHLRSPSQLRYAVAVWRYQIVSLYDRGRCVSDLPSVVTWSRTCNLSSTRSSPTCWSLHYHDVLKRMCNTVMRLRLTRTVSNIAGITIIIVRTLILCALFVQLLAGAHLSLRVYDVSDGVGTVFLEIFPETQLPKHEAS